MTETLSPFSKIFLSLMERIEATVPEIKHIDQDLGQIEGASSRPSVAFPCVLVDFENWVFENHTDNCQKGEGDVIITLAFAQYVPSSESAGPEYRAEALKYYEHEQKIHMSLQGWSPNDESGYLTRTGIATLNKLVGIRVRKLRYRLEFEDNSTKPVIKKVTRPPLKVTGETE